MTNKECARLLVELHAEYSKLAEKYGWIALKEYAEAVAMAIMALPEKEGREDGK